MDQSSIRPLKAALWMIGTVVSFSTMAVAGREAIAELDTFEIMTYRSLLSLVAIFIFVVLTRKTYELRGDSFGLHLLRNSMHFAATNLWFFAVGTITLAQVFAFEFTAPLWTAALAPLLLGENLTKTRIVATLIGFIGILIITRPGIVEFSPGMAAAICCAVGFAGAAITTRKLVSRQSVIAIQFWMYAIQSVLGIICAGIDFNIALPSKYVLLPLLLVAVSGVSAHLCLTVALTYAPATLVMPMDFVRLPLIAIIGLLLYQEAIDLFMIIGAILILYANFINIRH